MVPVAQVLECVMMRKSKHNLNVQANYGAMFLCLNYFIYRVSQEERTKLREGVPYVKVYRYNPKHLCPKLNGFRDNGK